jgi:putative phosphoribosyl transferase
MNRDGLNREVLVETDSVELPGILTVPVEARGLVIFAHGSGSSRHSPRNQFVAGVLSDDGMATVLFDLLTRAEAEDRANVFDIGLLAKRLEAVRVWSSGIDGLGRMPVAYFGASTGAAAALVAAASGTAAISTVVSRGGRPDLADKVLGDVRCPVLLIVGGSDPVVLRLNREAMAELPKGSRLEVIPGAGHLFEEPGALERVASQANDWFSAHWDRARRAT